MVKVVDWIHYDRNMPDYPRTDSEDVWDAVVADIVQNKYCFDAQYHQYGEHGVPVIEFDDGERLPTTYTQRVFGRLMAQAHNIIEKSERYNYVDFYYGLPNGKGWKYP